MIDDYDDALGSVYLGMMKEPYRCFDDDDDLGSVYL